MKKLFPFLQSGGYGQRFSTVLRTASGISFSRLWMSVIISPMTDLSVNKLWRFLITVLESPKTVNLLTPSLIPNFIACNPAYASAVNGSAIFEWVTACDARVSLFSFRAIILEADLNPKRS
ncbi:hypothetical protein Gotri_025515 [Gossypium trilobum]|uniref:Uncharacterized protein n=1 Tax=Gossypium trilobum TaxID=34281 RepID=A0A7J9FJQ5_9ROSI|nr:hypothetical protein [Gossypium trilobum]